MPWLRGNHGRSTRERAFHLPASTPDERAVHLRFRLESMPFSWRYTSHLCDARAILTVAVVRKCRALSLRSCLETGRADDRFCWKEQAMAGAKAKYLSL